MKEDGEHYNYPVLQVGQELIPGEDVQSKIQAGQTVYSTPVFYVWEIK